jgi:hypothetical protein
MDVAELGGGIDVKFTHRWADAADTAAGVGVLVIGLLILLRKAALNLCK